MASVPKSQYDDLQKRHENMRKNREREQRRCSKLEAENLRLRSELKEVLEWARVERAPLREQEIASTVRALGQMRAKGAVAAQEMTRQLAEVGIPAWRYLADAIGVDVPKAMALVERRAVSAEVGISAILKGMTKDFGGAMAKQARTLIGLWSTLKDEFRAVGRGFGFYLSEIIGLEKLLGGLINGFRNLANVIRAAESPAKGFRQILANTFSPELRPIILGIAGALMGALYPALALVAKALLKGTLLLAPFMLKGIAVAAAAYTIHRAWQVMGSGIVAVSAVIVRTLAAIVQGFSVLFPGMRGVATAMNDFATRLTASVAPADALNKQADTLKEQQDGLTKTAGGAAGAQEALGQSMEEAAKKASRNIMAFDQVHQLQEDMAAAVIGPQLDPGKLQIPEATLVEPQFDPGPLTKLAENWENMRSTLVRLQPVLEGVGYVMAAIGVKVIGTQVVQLATLALKWAALAATATLKAGIVAAAWGTKAAAAVASVATQIGAKAALISKWASLAATAVANAATVAGAWVVMQVKALASLVAQAPVFVALGAKWAALAAAALANATKMASAWLIALGPKAWVIAAVVAIAAAVIANWESVRATTQTIWTSVSTWLSAQWQALSATATALWTGLAQFFATTWTGISLAAVTAWTTLGAWLSAHWTALKTTATTLWNGVAAYFSGLWASISSTAIAAWTSLTTWLSGHWTAFSTRLAEIWNGIRTTAAQVWEAIRTAIHTPIAAVTTWLSSTWSATSLTLANLWGTIRDTAVNIWTALRTRATELWESVRQAATSPVERLRTWLADAWNTIRTTALNAFASLRDGVLGVWNGIVSGISNTVAAILGPINSIVQAVQNALSWLSRLGGAQAGGTTTPRPPAPLPPLPSVPHLATGGIVRKPTLAMIGEGRHDEAVIPLKRGMDMFGGEAAAQTIAAAVYQAIYDAMRVSRIEQQGESRQEVVIELDGVKLGRVLVPSIVREGRRLGSPILRIEGGMA